LHTFGKVSNNWAMKSALNLDYQYLSLCKKRLRTLPGTPFLQDVFRLGISLHLPFRGWGRSNN
jgi:hypothetical protein